MRCQRCSELQREMHAWVKRAAATEINEANLKLAIDAIKEIFRKIRVHHRAPKSPDRKCFGICCYDNDYCYAQFETDAEAAGFKIPDYNDLEEGL